MRTNREKVELLLNKFYDSGVTEQMILDFILNDYLSGSDAYEALQQAEQEFFEDASFEDSDYSFDEDEED